MEISYLIKHYRKLHKLTQSELGDKIGVSQDTISIWEKGKAQPNYDAIRKMCVIFNLSGDELLQIETSEQRRQVNININNSGTINNSFNNNNF